MTTMRQLIGRTVWCQNNNHSLNEIKTNRKRRTEHASILIDGAAVEQVERFKFLDVHITNKLTWSKHNKTVVKRAQQNLFPLRRLKRFGIGPQILKRFYCCTIESILTGCITAWYMATARPPTARHYRVSVYGPIHHRGQASCHPGPLYQAVSEEGPKNGQRLQPP
jgi:hypothetical protein